MAGGPLAGGPLERVVLVGFMGAGKTVVGQCLAGHLGWRFIDLDQQVEARAGESVRQIIERHGEAEFRRLEHLELCQTLEDHGVVIAAGGGTMVFDRNRRAMGAAAALSVWLDPSFETILGRLDTIERDIRPLFRNVDQARRLYEERLPAYGLADHRIEVVSDETADGVAGRIRDLIRDRHRDRHGG